MLTVRCSDEQLTLRPRVEEMTRDREDKIILVAWYLFIYQNLSCILTAPQFVSMSEGHFPRWQTAQLSMAVYGEKNCLKKYIPFMNHSDMDDSKFQNIYTRQQ